MTCPIQVNLSKWYMMRTVFHLAPFACVLQLHLAALASLKGDVVELNKRLQQTERERDMLEKKLAKAQTLSEKVPARIFSQEVVDSSNEVMRTSGTGRSSAATTRARPSQPWRRGHDRRQQG
ncbi:UNVERIFIED_CONTAM: hypothetical protein K2H54_056172 [Gekko kuhli]